MFDCVNHLLFNKLGNGEFSKMKRILAMVAVVALVVSPIFAEEAAVAKDAAKDLTLKGKITKTTVETKVTFTLATADAKIELPALTKEQEILDTDVEVAVKAVTGADKKVTVKEVVKVTKAEAAKAAPVVPAVPAAPAPAAPAAPEKK